MTTNNHTSDISYLKGILFLTIEESYPEKAIDLDFIEQRTALAEESYELSIREGKTPIEAEEIAKEVLFRGLGFSKISAIRTVLYTEFADYADWDTNIDTAHKLMPHLEYVFAKYTLTDDFEESEESENLYNELTGAIDLIFEGDGI